MQGAFEDHSDGLCVSFDVIVPILAPVVAKTKAVVDFRGGIGQWKFEEPAIATGSFQYGSPITSWSVHPLLSHEGAGLSRSGSAFGAPASPD